MHFYRALLHLFPRSFRAEYGAEMQKDFAREWNAANAGSENDPDGHDARRRHRQCRARPRRHPAAGLEIRAALAAAHAGFTITAILVGAIGIGATTATFSIADHVLIRPFPFADPDALVTMTENHAALGYPQMEPSPPNYRDWKRMATSFESVEAINGDSRTLVGSGEPERIVGSQVTGGVFRCSDARRHRPHPHRERRRRDAECRGHQQSLLANTIRWRRRCARADADARRVHAHHRWRHARGLPFPGQGHRLLARVTARQSRQTKAATTTT